MARTGTWSFVPAGTTVVVALHIPTAFAGKDEKPFDYAQAERSLCNHRALHRLLEPYDAHIVSGHMHTTTNCPVREGLYEHNVAALSGAWWQGAICTDGTPAGYAVFEVDGGEVSWYYKSVGHPRSFQLKIYDSKDDEAFAGRIVANVWNCDPAWTVEMRADGGRPVWMERTTAVDPQARRLYAMRRNSTTNGSRSHSRITTTRRRCPPERGASRSRPATASETRTALKKE